MDILLNELFTRIRLCPEIIIDLIQLQPSVFTGTLIERSHKIYEKLYEMKCFNAMDLLQKHASESEVTDILPIQQVDIDKNYDQWLIFSLIQTDSIKEALLQTAIYCGVPAANSAFALAQKVFAEMDAASGP